MLKTGAHNKYTSSEKTRYQQLNCYCAMNSLRDNSVYQQSLRPSDENDEYNYACFRNMQVPNKEKTQRAIDKSTCQIMKKWTYVNIQMRSYRFSR